MSPGCLDHIIQKEKEGAVSKPNRSITLQEVITKYQLINCHVRRV